jgi:soluble lytic murein transglycosylase-like protein
MTHALIVRTTTKAQTPSGRTLTWHRLTVAGLLLMMLAGVEASAADRSIYTFRDRSGTRHFGDIKISPNAYAYIARFGRPSASSSCMGLTSGALDLRAATYDALIAKHARTYQVEPGLVKAVMRVESCFDRKAVSTVGAQGLMQLMPGTAASLGVNDSFDADQNIRGGTRYLRMMLDRFNNKVDLALAAYNAGPEAVKRHDGIPPYRETQSYVRRIKTYYQPKTST